MSETVTYHDGPVFRNGNLGVGLPVPSVTRSSVTGSEVARSRSETSETSPWEEGDLGLGLNPQSTGPSYPCGTRNRVRTYGSGLGNTRRTDTGRTDRGGVLGTRVSLHIIPLGVPRGKSPPLLLSSCSDSVSTKSRLEVSHFPFEREQGMSKLRYSSY